MCPKAHAPQQEKPLQWEACALQLERSPTCSNQRKAQAVMKTKRSQKLKKKKKHRLKYSKWLSVYCFLEPNFVCFMWRLIKLCGKCGCGCGRCNNVFTHTKTHIKKYLRVYSKLLTFLHLTALFSSICGHMGPLSTVVCILLDHEFKSHGLQLWCVRN